MSDKREGRAEEVPEPPLEGGGEPPLAEPPELPTERVVVYGDASATYGSMVAPEVIRPHAEKLDEVLEPERHRQEEPAEEELEEELKHRHKDEHKKKGHK
jgi:hypothetical protein